MTWSLRLRTLRAALGWTQRKLAAHLGVALSTVRNIESGVTARPSTSVVVAVRRIESAYHAELAMIDRASEGLRA